MKTSIILLFVGMVIAQLFIPSKMIFDHQKVSDTGKAFRFKLEPIDPNDPFRGKYIILNFEADKFEVNENTEWAYNEKLNVEIETDEEGFVVIKNIYQAEDVPVNSNFVKAELSHFNRNNDKYQLHIKYPFDIFFMEESKAKPVEDKFRAMRRDSSTIAWAEVKVLDGIAVLDDVMINGISIMQILE